MTPGARARLSLAAAAALFSTGGAAIKATHLDAFQVAGLPRGGRIEVEAIAILPSGASAKA